MKGGREGREGTYISFSSFFLMNSGEKAFILSDLLHARNTGTLCFNTVGSLKMVKRKLNDKEREGKQNKKKTISKWFYSFHAHSQAGQIRTL